MEVLIEILVSLNKYSGSLSVLFSATVTVATIFYVVLTRQLVNETKRLRKVETDPHISIYIEPEDRWINFIDLIIKNTGRGPAYNIKFKIEPDFLMLPKSKSYLSKIPFMQQLDYLSPGQLLRFFLAKATDVLKRKDDNSFSIIVSYKSKDGNRFQEEYKIDFDNFRGMMSSGEPPIHKIAKAIGKIAEDIHHVRTDFSRIRTDVYTSKDREQEIQEHEAIDDSNLNLQRNDQRP